MPDPDTVRQPLLELGDLRAEDELPVVENPLDAGVDRFAKLAVLGLEVDEVQRGSVARRAGGKLAGHLQLGFKGKATKGHSSGPNGSSKSTLLVVASGTGIDRRNRAGSCQADFCRTDCLRTCSSIHGYVRAIPSASEKRDSQPRLRILSLRKLRALTPTGPSTCFSAILLPATLATTATNWFTDTYSWRPMLIGSAQSDWTRR